MAAKFKELETGTVRGGYKYSILMDNEKILVFPPIGNGISITLEALEDIVREVRIYRLTGKKEYP